MAVETVQTPSETESNRRRSLPELPKSHDMNNDLWCNNQDYKGYTEGIKTHMETTILHYFGCRDDGESNGQTNKLLGRGCVLGAPKP